MPFIRVAVEALGRGLVEGPWGRLEFRVQNTQSWAFHMREGWLKVEAPPVDSADCYIGADPATMPMVTMGMMSQADALASGAMRIWGPSPTLGHLFKSRLPNA